MPPSFSYSLEMIFPGASLSAVALAAVIEMRGLGAVVAARAALPTPSAETRVRIRKDLNITGFLSEALSKPALDEATFALDYANHTISQYWLSGGDCSAQPP